MLDESSVVVDDTDFRRFLINENLEILLQPNGSSAATIRSNGSSGAQQSHQNAITALMAANLWQPKNGIVSLETASC